MGDSIPSPVAQFTLNRTPLRCTLLCLLCFILLRSCVSEPSQYSEFACTADQKLEVRADATSACIGVDCSAKYGVWRPVWNPRTRLCSSFLAVVSHTIDCLPGFICAPPSTSVTPYPPPPSPPRPLLFSQPPSPSPSGPVPPATTPPPPPPPLPNCGGHGTLQPINQTCVCDSGWSTSPNQDLAAFIFCNLNSTTLTFTMGDMPPSSSTMGGGGASSPTGSPSAWYGRLKIAETALVVVAVLLLVGGLVFCCCRQRYLKKESSAEKLMRMMEARHAAGRVAHLRGAP